jgi:hypothetical protein
MVINWLQMYYRQTFCQQINIGQNDTLNEISDLEIQKFRKFIGVESLEV